VTSKLTTTEISSSTCFECDHSKPSEIQLHHVVPRSMGGTRVIPLCSICHSKVHGVKRGGQVSISELTKSGLAAAKARGVAMGNPNWQLSVKLATAASLEALKPIWAEQLKLVEEIRESGTETLTGIARCLNARGVRGARGGFWTATTVNNLLKRKAICKNDLTSWA